MITIKKGKLKGEYCNTEMASKFLGVTVQRVNQLQSEFGIGKVDRDLFSVKAIINFASVRSLAKALKMDIKDISFIGRVHADLEYVNEEEIKLYKALIANNRTPKPYNIGSK